MGGAALHPIRAKYPAGAWGKLPICPTLLGQIYENAPSYDLWQFRRILVDLALSVMSTIHFLCFSIYNPATAGEVKGPGTDVVRGANGGLAAPVNLPRNCPAGYVTLIGQPKNIILFRSHWLSFLSARPVQSKRKRLFS